MSVSAVMYETVADSTFWPDYQLIYDEQTTDHAIFQRTFNSLIHSLIAECEKGRRSK